MRKCKKNKPCKGCEEFHDKGNPDFMGLIVSTTINIHTGERGRKIGYRFPRNSEHKGVLWLNFCPWCGVDQEFKTKKKKVKNA